MSKRQIRELLSKLLPHLKSAKQRLALFTLLLLLVITPVKFDSVHLHVESEPIAPSVTVSSAATGNVSATVRSYSWPGKCGLKGGQPSPGYKVCPACDGTGQGTSTMLVETPCPECGGTGQVKAG